MSTVHVVTLGATALLAYDPATQGMELRLPPEELLAQACQGLTVTGIQARLRALPLRSGAELTFSTLAAVRDVVLAQLLPDPAVAGCVLLAGTDTLDEAAWVLHLMLAHALARHGGKPLVLTGAMRPADALGSDNARNLRDALVVAAHPATRALGGATLVVLNDAIHLAQHVQKSDSQLLGAFTSPSAGPIGHVRGGQPRFHFRPPPLDGYPEEAFEGVPAEALERLAQKVIVWTCGVSTPLPPPVLLEGLSGLVLAGCGTGSLPAALVDLLTDTSGGRVAWTACLACIITSRCAAGDGVDDFSYKGSRAKYEQKGFMLGDYAPLTPLQARALLILRLASARPR